MRQMKDSGIEWIGEIPENWKKTKGKNLFSITTGKLDVNAENPKGEYPFFTCSMFPKKIDTYSFDCEALLVAGNGLVGYTQYYCGKFDAYQRTYVLSNFMGVNPLFLKYYVSNNLSIEVAPKSVGSVIQFIKLGDLQNFSIVLPPLPEQQAISAHLDRQCAHIDNIIEKTKASVEEYKKLRQAVITQAVTKGVRGDRPMKDSGIEWIGEIPEEWETTKVRYIGKLQNGISKGAEFFGEGYPFVSYGDVYKNYVIPQNVNGLVKTSEDERKQYSVITGDIFFTRTSETIEEVGFSAVCENTIENATFAGFVIRLRPYEVDSIILTSYAKYYFRGEQIRKYLVKEMNLVTRASLGQGLLNAMSVLMPPKSEQKEIASFLDKKCAEIDTLIAKKEQFLTELESYKKSMIYEYVTGKKEVPTA